MYKWANIRIVLSIFEVCRVTANSGVVWITFGVRLGPSNVCCMLLWWLVEAGLTAHWRPLYLSAKCWTPPSLAPGSPSPWTPRPWWAPAPAPAIASSPNCMLIWNGDKMKEEYYNFLQNDAAFCCNISAAIIPRKKYRRTNKMKIKNTFDLPSLTGLWVGFIGTIIGHNWRISSRDRPKTRDNQSCAVQCSMFMLLVSK